MPDERLPGGPITVFLADDNLIVREGVRALLSLEPGIEVLGTAADYDSLLAGAEAAAPQVLVTDIRMPPTFQKEGIEAAQELRKRHPGTGVVVLSQYDDPDYALSLLGAGSAGYAYLLKDDVAQGDQLVRAVRAVATGGSMLDPKIVNALVRPVASASTDLTAAEEELLRLVAEGRPIKAIAAAQATTAAGVAADVAAALAHLRFGESGRAERTFTLGFCLGGRMSLLQAAAGHGLSGVIGFYPWPVGEHRSGLPAPADRAREFGCPVLVLYGGADIFGDACRLVRARFPTATQVRVDAAAHFPWLQAPSFFAAVLAEFYGPDVGGA